MQAYTLYSLVVFTKKKLFDIVLLIQSLNMPPFFPPVSIHIKRLLYFCNLLIRDYYTAWKVSKYGVICGPYFPVFGLNTDTFHAVFTTKLKDGSVIDVWQYSKFASDYILWKLPGFVKDCERFMRASVQLFNRLTL